VSAPDPVLSLGDLDRWSFPGTALAVLGHPIAHSLSPAMHNAALAALARTDARFASWRYFKFEVEPEKLLSALDRFHAEGFLGLNLTVPHKVIALARVAAPAPDLQAIGAVNTLAREQAPGAWAGHNTDGYGLAAALRDDLGATLTGSPVILLGAGGAARGAAVECLRRGCAALWIANRTRARLEDLLVRLGPLAAAVPLRGFEPPAPPADLPAGAFVINATSLGLRAGDAAPIDLARLPRPAGVYDMIYNPANTPLLRQAAALGVPHANGLSMLVHQGAKSLEIWSGVPAERTAPTMRRAAEAALRPH
jgi:shikimate dehydrogenase